MHSTAANSFLKLTRPTAEQYNLACPSLRRPWQFLPLYNILERGETFEQIFKKCEAFVITILLCIDYSFEKTCPKTYPAIM